MLNHCLLHVDSSDEWNRVPAYLPVISSLLGVTHLTLVYVIESYLRHGGDDTEQVRLKTLEALALGMQDELGITVDYKLCTGLVVAETLRVAKLLNADGIITLNHSHSASRELFLGNVALNLARMSHLPLLILPSDGEIPSLEAPIILAYDCSKSANEAHRQFKDLLASGARGIVLTADDPEYASESDHASPRIEALSEQHNDGVEVRQLKGHPIEEILNTAAHEGSPLIVTGKRGNNPEKNMLLGHIAEGVARLSRRPVLLVPKKNATLAAAVYS